MRRAACPKWIRRWSSEPTVAGSSPARVTFATRLCDHALLRRTCWSDVDTESNSGCLRLLDVHAHTYNMARMTPTPNDGQQHSDNATSHTVRHHVQKMRGTIRTEAPFHMQRRAVFHCGRFGGECLRTAKTHAGPMRDGGSTACGIASSFSAHVERARCHRQAIGGDTQARFQPEALHPERDALHRNAHQHASDPELQRPHLPPVRR